MFIDFSSDFYVAIRERHFARADLSDELRRSGKRLVERSPLDVISVHDPRNDLHDVIMAPAAPGRTMRGHLYFVEGLFYRRKVLRLVDDFFDIRDGYVHAMAYGFVFRHTDPILLFSLVVLSL